MLQPKLNHEAMVNHRPTSRAPVGAYRRLSIRGVRPLAGTRRHSGERMRFFCFVRGSDRVESQGLAMVLALTGTLLAGGVEAQTIDCGRLQAQIAQAGSGGGGSRYAAAARKQASELARTQGYAHQLGCDGGFSFFGGGDPQCGGLNQRIAQMQANLGQLQAARGGGGQRADLVARFNASCRGGQPQQQQPRGFFESLFGGGQPERQAPLPEAPVGPQDGQLVDGEGDGINAHGGSQVVCVRTCDGGFFPMGLSGRRGQDNLNEMCTALCPGAEATVYTRNPDADIKTAVSLDGKPYMDLPNALKYQKSVADTCSCHPPGKTWAEALANAEALNEAHKGDILVTQAKSDEMSRPNLDAKARAALLKKPATAMVTPEAAGKITASNAIVSQPLPDAAPATPAPAEAIKPTVRRVGPQP